MSSDGIEPLILIGPDDALRTEEELKAKVIIPWLDAIGVGLGDVKLERVLQVKLGRYRVNLRYDFLVSLSGRPLFFIEAKRHSHPLSDEDRTQALNYSRVHPPMAPVTILTNGVTTEVLETVSGERIDGTVVTITDHPYLTKFELDPGAALRMHTEALLRLITLNESNLRDFAAAQRAYRWSHLVEQHDGLRKKVLPDLFVPSQEMLQKWRAFAGSNDRVLVVLGEAGLGKTNVIWSWCSTAASDMFAIFFDAGRITRSLWGSLCDDFDWTFSAAERTTELVRQLRQIAVEAQTDVVIFVDAIEENSHPGFEAALDEFCRRLADHGIRIVLGCRRWDWARFTTIHDSPTWLQDNATVVDLPPFTDDELGRAWPKYAHAFAVAGDLTGPVAHQCRDRFTLRALCEVYAGGEAPERIDVPKLVTHFVERRLAKSADSLTSAACLSAMAKDSFANQRGAIPGDDFLALPGASPEVRDELLSSELLVTGGDGTIRFAHGQVQNLFVSLRALHWDKISPSDFGAVVREAFGSVVGQQALAWFALHYPEHGVVILQTVEGQALAYIKRRNELIDLWAPRLRLALDPGTDRQADIHLLTAGQTLTGAWYLSPTTDEGPSVRLTPSDAPPGLGPRLIHFGDTLHASRASEVLADEIDVALGGSQLHQSQLRLRPPFLPSPTIIDELVFAEAATSASDLHLDDVVRCAGSMYAGSFTRSELQQGIRRWSASWIAQNKVVEAKIERGEATVTVKDGIRSAGFSLTGSDQAEIDKIAERILASGEKIDVPDVTGHAPPVPLLVRLLDCTNSDEFSAQLPLPDTELPMGGLLESLYSAEAKRAYLSAFFAAAVPALREAASALLGPTVRDHAPWLLGPIALAWWLEPSAHITFREHGVVYALGPALGGADVVSEADMQFNVFDGSAISVSGTSYDAVLRTGTGFDSFLTSHHRQTDQRRSAPTPIFDWALNQLHAALSKAALVGLFSRG